MPSSAESPEIFPAPLPPLRALWVPAPPNQTETRGRVGPPGTEVTRCPASASADPAWNFGDLNPGSGKPVLWETRSFLSCELKGVFGMEGGSGSARVEDPGPSSRSSSSRL